eukprot:gb/GECH01005835.1/.p1 GENE.gb/GECH01005835.1/~~gb/GECH01005835.1/.p1  ORF type:complete len:312 (+),score=53.84 gb/GECH01005835.1/:1-936(+)
MKHKKYILSFVIIGTLFLACSLVIPGAIVYTQPTPRESKINNYNNAVKIWQQQYFRQFVSQGYYMENSVDNQRYILRENTNKDPLNDYPRDDEEFLDYDVVKFSVPIQLFPNNQDFEEEYFVSRQVFSNRTREPIFNIEEIVFREETFKPDRRSDCGSNQGYFDRSDALCHMFYAVSSMCAKAPLNNPNNDDTDNSNNSDDSLGCFVKTFDSNQFEKNKAVFIDGDASQYSKLPPGENGPPSQLDNYNSGPFTIRHPQDPYLVALRITDGTLDFGTPGSYKGNLGLTLMGVGGGLAILGFAISFQIWNRSK